ncbi:MAG: Formate hydrogenlyase subunit 6/NADH:ubiquinone oxidoreductase subunit (chain I) [Chloroflexi bacterium]|jgi:NADH-quinone oxidoreductase subunit I|nr:MAG: Formate hydrogenlyase subunit 6/NADH:ubiquinone oxidoreductase subunit (chain I) [Chloroflexota bacterium]
MLGSIKGLKVTLSTMMRKPVTAQYPIANKRLDIKKRFMGFPALLWDDSNSEPYCTGCMVCVRECPTQCMTATMADNKKFSEGKSTRKKIIDSFGINLSRCIVCGICVDVCNFDAIEMSHEHELSKFQRNANRANLKSLLAMGKTFQSKIKWEPIQIKNIGNPDLRERLQAAAKAQSEKINANEGKMDGKPEGSSL